MKDASAWGFIGIAIAGIVMMVYSVHQGSSSDSDTQIPKIIELEHQGHTFLMLENGTTLLHADHCRCHGMLEGRGR